LENQISVLKQTLRIAEEYLARANRIASKIKESAPSESTNCASPKPAPEIVESRNPCRYCRKFNSGEWKCAIPEECNDHDHFDGRRLQA